MASLSLCQGISHRVLGRQLLLHLSTARCLRSKSSSANAAGPSSSLHSHASTCPESVYRNFSRQGLPRAHRFHTFVICSSIIVSSRESFLRCASVFALRHVAASAASPKLQSNRLSKTTCGELVLRRSPFALCWLKPLRIQQCDSKMSATSPVSMVDHASCETLFRRVARTKVCERPLSLCHFARHP